MITRVLLVRHGATNRSAEDRFSGASDAQLSDDGREQIAKLAARLASTRISAVYASPLSRARDTAELLARPHGLPINERDGLREISHGHWEGFTRAEVAERFPEEYALWQSDSLTFAPSGGETPLNVLGRALPALSAITQAHAGQTVLVVSHKATLRLLMACVLGLDVRLYRKRFEQMPGCLNIVELGSDGSGRLMLFNDVSHYAP